MIKVMTWFRRRPGMALDDFRGYWRNEHPKVVLRMPGLRKYCQNHVTDDAYRDGRQPFCDGVAETWWDSLDVLRDLDATDELGAVMADEAEFIDPDQRDQFVASEVVVVNGAIPPGTPPKQITWIRFHDDMTPEAAQAYWRDTHGPLAAKLPGSAATSRTTSSLARTGRDGPGPSTTAARWCGSTTSTPCGRPPGRTSSPPCGPTRRSSSATPGCRG